jgi:ParB family chromosome partitioning protein
MSLLAALASTPPPPAAKQVLKATGSLQKLSGEMLANAEPEKLREFQELLRQKLAEVEEALKQK